MPAGRPGRRKPIIGAIGVIAAIGIGVGIWQSTGGGGGVVIPPPSSGPPPTTFNVWVSPTGNDTSTACTNRQSTAQANNPAGVNTGCLTFQKAYSVAQCGDNIGVYAPSSAPMASQTIALSVSKSSGSTGCGALSGVTPGSGPGCREGATWQDGSTTTADFSQCITFAPAGGITQAFVGGVNVHGSMVWNVPYVRLWNIVFPDPTDLTNEATSGSLTFQARGVSTANECNTANVHDIIVNGFNGTAVTFTGVYYGTLENSDIGPNVLQSSPTDTTANGISQIGDCLPGNSTTQRFSYWIPNHLLYYNNIWHDQTQNARNTSNTTVNHSECIHVNDGSYFNWQNNKFINCVQQDISFEADALNCTDAPGNNVCATIPDATETHILLENNIFDQACSNQAAAIAAGFNCGPISEVTFIACKKFQSINDAFTVRYNSFDPGDAFSLQNDATDDGGTPPTLCSGGNPPATAGSPGSGSKATITLEGNVGLAMCQTSSVWTPTSKYNVGITPSSVSCGTGNVSGAASAVYTSAGLPNYNYTPPTGSPSINLVPTSEPCPQTDITGANRPSGTAPCSAGAYQG